MIPSQQENFLKLVKLSAKPNQLKVLAVFTAVLKRFVYLQKLFQTAQANKKLKKTTIKTTPINKEHSSITQPVLYLRTIDNNLVK